MSFPFEVEVEHVTSHVRRTMQATGVRAGKVIVAWPLCDYVRFSLKTGAGSHGAPSWFITAESLERLKLARAKRVCDGSEEP